MKVIEKGNGQKGWAKEFKCTGKGNENAGCGATLLVEQDDLYETQSHSLGETDSYTTFMCPECGCETDIDGVPDAVVVKRASRTAIDTRKKAIRAAQREASRSVLPPEEE